MYEKFCDVLPPTREKKRETLYSRSASCLSNSFSNRSLVYPIAQPFFRLLLLLFGKIIPKNFCTSRIKAMAFTNALYCALLQSVTYCVLCGIYLLKSETFHNKPKAAKQNEFIDFRLSHSLWPFDLLEMTCWQCKHHEQRWRRHITRRIHNKMTQFLLDISVNDKQKQKTTNW